MQLFEVIFLSLFVVCLVVVAREARLRPLFATIRKEMTPVRALDAAIWGYRHHE
jgi:hypothetical protein